LEQWIDEFSEVKKWSAEILRIGKGNTAAKAKK
jgi:hypothetical protein